MSGDTEWHMAIYERKWEGPLGSALSNSVENWMHS